MTLDDAYTKKAHTSLAAARLLFEHNFLEEATTLAYYAMYHKATALLHTANITCTTHEHTIKTLEIFGADTSVLLHAKKERIEKQYYVDSTVKKEQTSTLLETVHAFIAELDILQDSLTPQNIQEIHERFHA